jgi:hypothetical protein
VCNIFRKRKYKLPFSNQSILFCDHWLVFVYTGNTYILWSAIGVYIISNRMIIDRNFPPAPPSVIFVIHEGGSYLRNKSWKPEWPASLDCPFLIAHSVSLTFIIYKNQSVITKSMCYITNRWSQKVCVILLIGDHTFSDHWMVFIYNTHILWSPPNRVNITHTYILWSLIGVCIYR